MGRTTARHLTKLSETSYSSKASVPQVRLGYILGAYEAFAHSQSAWPHDCQSS